MTIGTMSLRTTTVSTMTLSIMVVSMMNPKNYDTHYTAIQHMTNYTRQNKTLQDNTNLNDADRLNRRSALLNQHHDIQPNAANRLN